MSFLVSLACVFGLQQLQVSPFPAQVGDEVTLRARRGDAGIAALVVQVELPGGRITPCGETDAGGDLRFVPAVAGYHVFAAVIDGVRTLAPLPVVPARARWPLALGTVPLGLALLWWNLSRARGRRAP